MGIVNTPVNFAFFDSCHGWLCGSDSVLSQALWSEFIPCIQMNADADQHGPKWKMIPAPYSKMLETVIIQYPVIYAFTGSTLSVNILKFVWIPGNTGMKTQVFIVFDIYSASVFCGRALGDIRTWYDPSAPIGTAVFMCIFYGIISPRAHLMTVPADGMSVFVECDVIRGRIRFLGTAVDIDQGVDCELPAFFTPKPSELA